MKFQYIVLLAALILFGCDEKAKPVEDFWRSISQDSLNIFSIKPTKFRFQGKRVYEANDPEKDFYANLYFNKYFFVENGQIKGISVSDSCSREYQIGNYDIFDGEKKIKSSANEGWCDIFLIPLIDFSLKENQAITVYGHKLELQKKIYDVILKDSVFQFNRYHNNNAEQVTVIHANFKHGIICIYDSLLHPSANPILYKVGFDIRTKKFTRPNYKLEKPDFDLSLIKEFQKD